MQRSKAGPNDSHMCKFSVAAGNLRCIGDLYADWYWHSMSFEVTLPNGEKRSRFLNKDSSEDARVWKPRNRLGHIKRNLRDNLLPEPHALLEAPRSQEPLGALGLWLSQPVGRDQNRICVLARADGKGPWDLRLYDAGKHQHFFSRSKLAIEPATPLRAPPRPAGPPATAPQPIRPGKGHCRPSETSQLSRGSAETPEQAARRASASNRRPSAVSQKSQRSVKA